MIKIVQCENMIDFKIVNFNLQSCKFCFLIVNIWCEIKLEDDNYYWFKLFFYFIYI